MRASYLYGSQLTPIMASFCSNNPPTQLVPLHYIHPQPFPKEAWLRGTLLPNNKPLIYNKATNHIAIHKMKFKHVIQSTAQRTLLQLLNSNSNMDKHGKKRQTG